MIINNLTDDYTDDVKLGESVYIIFKSRIIRAYLICKELRPEELHTTTELTFEIPDNVKIKMTCLRNHTGLYMSRNRYDLIANHRAVLDYLQDAHPMDEKL